MSDWKSGLSTRCIPQSNKIRTRSTYMWKDPVVIHLVDSIILTKDAHTTNTYKYIHIYIRLELRFIPDRVNSYTTVCNFCSVLPE